MPFSIDTASYPKAKTFPPGHGYQLRTGSPTSIVIHSTSNPREKNTPFASEAIFLYRAANVSAHYLIAKDGRIVQFLDPAGWMAWHAGGKQAGGSWTAKPEYANPASIGIELHHSVGDPPYPHLQIDALTWLVRDLMGMFRIGTSLIDTHRAIALPQGRKSDPSDWDDPSFYAWRAALIPARATVKYIARHTEAIQEAPHAAAPVALNDTARVPEGAIVEVDEERGDGYLHLASGVGFVRKGVFSKQ